jgi:hypothetical protein
MKKKVVFLVLLLAATIGQVYAEGVKIRELFVQMPDSLMPYLTKNNRLDFVDFLDSNMKAEVKNQLGGTSEMLSMADDSLVIRMNPSLRVDMLLMDSVIAMVETFTVDSVYGQSRVRYFSTSWQPVANPNLNAAEQKRIQRLEMQNILKRDEEIMNKR